MKRILLIIILCLTLFSSTCLAEDWKMIVGAEDAKTYIDFDSIQYESIIIGSTHTLIYYKKSIFTEYGKKIFLDSISPSEKEKLQNVYASIELCGISLDNEHKMIGSDYLDIYIDSSKNIIAKYPHTPKWEKLQKGSMQYEINVYALSYAYDNFQKVMDRGYADKQSKKATTVPEKTDTVSATSLISKE